MKKIVSIIALLLITTTVSAQFYVSASGGYGFAANEDNVGINRTTYLNPTFTGFDSYENANVGSFGEGINGQLRIGYSFNEVFGLELSVGYLNGKDVDNNNVLFTSPLVTPIQESALVDMYARARAFGASLSAVANVYKNIYVRAGLLTKIGGKTENHTNIDFSSISPIVGPQVFQQPGAQLDVQADFQTNFKGKLPLGFVGAIGYKFDLSDKFGLFVEAEYLNIRVYRDSSSLESFSGTINGAETTAGDLANLLNSIGYEELSVLLEEDYDWSNSGRYAPYSSIGFNVGVTYKF